MIIVLQVVGALAVLIGVVTIGIGIPVKEFSFGNTLIVAGTVGLCTGLIMLGLSVVAMELRLVARRLAAGNGRMAAEPRARPTLPAFPAAGPVAAAPGDTGPDFSYPPPMAPQAEPAGAPPVPAAPWHEEPAGRARPPDAPMAPAEPEQATSASAQKPRRNLMFQSSVRKDRERPAAPADLRGQPPMAPPIAEMGEPPRPANFEDAWPRSDRPRAAERAAGPPDRAAEPPQRRRPPPSPAPAESNAPPAAAERAPPARAEEPPAGVTVLKSGVVDGMAYSLYSDGSIEAQMPEGMMRFASIDELRAHLDQRS
jgi:hypothetical protein